MPLIATSARVFEIVAQSSSIRRASERLNIAASAVNRRILALEEEFGLPLFERHARGVRLTEAGTLVASLIRSWQTEFAELHSSITTLKGRSPSIRLGAMECLAQDYLPKLLNNFKEVTPDSPVTATVGSTKLLYELLQAGEIDIAIAFDMPDSPSIQKVKELNVPLGAVVRSSHPLSRLTEAGINDLITYPILTADSSMSIGPLISVLLERLRIPVEKVAKTNSITLLKAMVQSGDSIGFMTLIDAYKEIESGQFHFLPISGSNLIEHLSVSIRSEKQPDRIAQFVEMTVDSFSGFSEMILARENGPG